MGALAALAPVPVALVGRNAPCPCGSGKKAKRCCQGRPVPATQVGLDAPPLLHSRALAACQAGDFDMALGLLIPVAERPDCHAELLFLLGRAFAETAQWAESLACFERVLAQRPHDARAHTNRGLALVELERAGEAIAAH